MANSVATNFYLEIDPSDPSDPSVLDKSIWPPNSPDLKPFGYFN